MKNIVLVLISTMLFLGCFGCGGAGKSVKSGAKQVRYNVGISEKFEGDTDLLGINELVEKELIASGGIKYIDRKKIMQRIAENRKALAEGTSEKIKLEEPIQYLVTGSVLTLGTKKIGKLTLLSVETGDIKSMVTFDIGAAEETRVKVKDVVTELLKVLTELTEK